MIEFNEVTFTYPGQKQPTLDHISFSIPEGAFTLVTGRSGAGKSTLLRCVNGLVPHFSGGRIGGQIFINGLDPVQAGPQVMSDTVGFVFQDIESQFVVGRVEDEIAFSLENAGIPMIEMKHRIDTVVEQLKIGSLRERKVETLSGGEAQIVAIACAMALSPSILVLDEPTSQLDPEAAERLVQILLRLNRENKVTILLAEHRLERIFPYATHMIYVDGCPGRVTSGTPGEVMAQAPLCPPVVSLARRLHWQPLPLTVEDAKRFAHLVTTPQKTVSNEPVKTLEAFLEIEHLKVNHGRKEILKDISLKINRGEIVVLMGANGTGKTTLLRTIMGIKQPEAGRIILNGRSVEKMTVAQRARQMAYLPQDPNAMLFADRVQDELMITMRNHQMPFEWEAAAALLSQLGLSEKIDAYPRDLSTGERQRTALGAVTITHPGGLLLDEPTRGMDYAAKQALGDLLKRWREDNISILLVTHDVEFAAQCADRVMVLGEGTLQRMGEARYVLSKEPGLTTQVAQLFPDRGWIIPEDVLYK
ncbi:MAG TPA: energy-coupling factor transporter ATPase [Anaerolineaceae bacterium]|nr:energy-coupling factor transporter ATPase [Anaerolineaceae bacterium]HPN52435.1 energy-coupling factor transporter ATPase [Anaerolineaceae bacterium]